MTSLRVSLLAAPLGLAPVLAHAGEDRSLAVGHEFERTRPCKRFLLRSAPRPTASLALRAAGVALPPTVQAVAAS